MKICLAQFRSGPDVACNLRRHLEMIRQAGDEGCDLVLFPELSLTGYEPKHAQRCAMLTSSDIFAPLQNACDATGAVVAVGAPLSAAGGIEIGVVVFRPSRPWSTYAKQLLHVDEEPYFVAGRRHLDFDVAGYKVAPAVCYESMQASHRSEALSRGATLYAASVAKTAGGMAAAHASLRSFASEHGVPVVVVNAVGPNDGFISAGRSAAWDAAGELAGELGDAEGMLICEY